jgi:prephenate dehydrogenase
MAGRETTGCLNGSENLFNNAAFYLTSDNENWIDPIKKLVEAIGAIPKCIDVEDHDRIVSFSSHVPHVTASLLVSILHEDISISETGGGYQDTTRIAASDPVMWTDIFLTNKEELLKSLDQFHSELHKVIAMIDKEDESALFDYLEQTRQKRLGEGGEKNGDHNRREAI